MISKELLSNVLNVKICIDDMKPHIQSNMLVYDVLNNDEINTSHINIYELAYKCKEWANNKGYSYIGNNRLINIYSQDNQIIVLVNKNIVNWYDVNVDFIACKWILHNKK